ncbi:putative Methyltransferase domain-containing protein [Azospirillaceae bacterium]
MGITDKTWKIVEPYLQPLNGKTMLELGNQQFYPAGDLAKIWFEKRGVAHISVDLGLNSDHGKYPPDYVADLTKDLPRRINKRFDIVTDFGTCEHMNMCKCPQPKSCCHPRAVNAIALYFARRNMREHCRSGGIMVFDNPAAGYWPGHGFHYFTEEHYTLLARQLGDTLLHLSTESVGHGNTQDKNITAVIRRSNVKFPPLNEYKRLYDLTIKQT